MSIRDALSFIQRVSKDPQLQDRTRALGRDAHLTHIVRLGAEAGFEFTVEELRTAFERDWAMRRLHYTGIEE